MRTIRVSEFAAGLHEFLLAVRAGETFVIESDEGDAWAMVSPAEVPALEVIPATAPAGAVQRIPRWHRTTVDFARLLREDRDAE